MAKPEWGIKRRCGGCSAAFYDFGKSPIVCPKCGVPYVDESPLRSRRKGAEAKSKPAAELKPKAKKVAPEADDDDDDDFDALDVDVDIEDEDEDDDALLADDEDDDVSDIVPGKASGDQEDKV
ncbi:FYDLN acid domain-containing protein [Oceanibacterium hippocampi]|uniref:TIGR02300 family protein n=1 Tax=Oceanibacterium hippocampi TaxID=745714 RepID=A0A1Y5RPR1_9PROT|nr:FYDLN acid domain-containing protein [Oceanibacterium hippocampi]SLN22593.1 Protein of unknown function (FYDLN_acid) [Oceanibacterium hippocampi]